MGILYEMFKPPTPKVLNVLYRFYPGGLTVTDIAKEGGMSRPTVYTGLENAMKNGMVKMRMGGFKLYSLDERTETVFHGTLDMVQKHLKTRYVNSSRYIWEICHADIDDLIANRAGTTVSDAIRHARELGYNQKQIRRAMREIRKDYRIVRKDGEAVIEIL